MNIGFTPNESAYSSYMGHMLISEMLYFENIWVWLDFRFYYESKLLILCSVSCSVAVVRLEGSFGHATRRMS
jgi:hypothetical protein